MPQTTSGVEIGVRDPRVGDTLLYDGGEYEVTGRSYYQNEEGYQVLEWCCETGESECYLLKEHSGRNKFSWFFTRWIDSKLVALTEGDSLDYWFKANPGRDAKPPASLAYDGARYAYKDSTSGRYRDDDGSMENKTTWDYWDAGEKKNLAIEAWENGEHDAYLGRYILPSEIRTRRLEQGALKGFPPNPYKSTAILIPVCAMFLYFVTEFDFPFDGVLGVGILGALAFMWAGVAAGRNPLLAAASLLLAAAAGAVHWHFPPLTTAAGFLFFLAAPAVFALLFRKLEEPNPRTRIKGQYLASFVLMAPLAALGLYHYFWNAPAPHTFDQYCLALLPAAIGCLAGYLLSTAIFNAGT